MPSELVKRSPFCHVLQRRLKISALLKANNRLLTSSCLLEMMSIVKDKAGLPIFAEWRFVPLLP